LSYKDFGLEYAYYFPANYESENTHHISIKFTLRNDYLEDIKYLY